MEEAPDVGGKSRFALPLRGLFTWLGHLEIKGHSHPQACGLGSGVSVGKAWRWPQRPGFQSLLLG